MKAVLLIVISLLYFSSTMNAEEKDDEFFSTVIGINYNYSTENDDAFLGFDLQLKESYKRFIIGFDTGIFYGLESPDDISLFTIRPSLGFYAYGDNKSTFKVIMSMSSGLLVGEDLKNGMTPYGTMSSIGFDVFYKKVGLTVRGINANSSVYNNRFGQIGFKFGF